jgi:Cu/Zn superoxide dismutase
MPQKRTRPTRAKNGEYRFADHPEFRPNLSPEEMFRLGSFGGTYWRPIYSSVTKKNYKNQHLKYPKSWWKGIPDNHLTRAWDDYDKSVNKYKVKVGTTLEFWEEKGWIRPSHPYGWVQWYCDFFRGERGEDDVRQIKRWQGVAGAKGRFRLWLANDIKRKGAKWDDETISPGKRQTLQHWAYKLTKADFNKLPPPPPLARRQRSRRQNGGNPKMLKAELEDYGSVVAKEANGKVSVEYSLKNLSTGDHGFHIHQDAAQGKGDVCKEAGPHYNPKGEEHGGLHSKERHVGDMGNIMADKDGIARGEVVMGAVDLADLEGRSVIVHERKDDLGLGEGEAREESLKTGNAGARLACGVFKRT